MFAFPVLHFGGLVGSVGSTVLDVEYADGSSGTHDLASSDLVLTYTDPDVHRITPQGVVTVDVDIWGAAGGWGQNVSVTTKAGAGAKVSITGLTLTGGVEYVALVGQGGQRGSATSVSGGFPDGGDHQGVTYASQVRGTGGGSSRFALASDLVDGGVDLADWNDSSSTYLAIAAGGGGASAGYGGHGGAGGADTGEDGGDFTPYDLGGHGGTQSAGGAGQTGRTGTGGSGGKYAGGDSQTASNDAAGTGGGGYYGGGSGGGYFGGGGGGSSLLDGSLSGSRTGGTSDTAPTGQPASYPNAGNANSLSVGYNGVIVISLAA